MQVKTQSLWSSEIYIYIYRQESSVTIEAIDEADEVMTMEVLSRNQFPVQFEVIGSSAKDGGKFKLGFRAIAISSYRRPKSPHSMTLYIFAIKCVLSINLNPNYVYFIVIFRIFIFVRPSAKVYIKLVYDTAARK